MPLVPEQGGPHACIHEAGTDGQQRVMISGVLMCMAVVRYGVEQRWMDDQSGDSDFGDSPGFKEAQVSHYFWGPEDGATAILI